MTNASNKPPLEILRIIDRLATIGQQISQFASKHKKPKEQMQQLGHGDSNREDSRNDFTDISREVVKDNDKNQFVS